MTRADDPDAFPRTPVGSFGNGLAEGGEGALFKAVGEPMT